MMAELDYTLLARYFSGLCASEETRALEAWTDESPTRRREIERLREIWTLGAQRPLAGRAEVGLRRVVGRTGLSMPRRAQGRLRLVTALGHPRRTWALAPIGVAAAALVLASAWLARRWVMLEPQPPVATVITTAPGQRLGLRLPDGTQVALAPGSALRTPREFGVGDRTVELDGEAVFTVAHDSGRAFAVRTSRAVTTDLGTRFAVRAYATDAASDVAVAEGRVAVRDRLGASGEARDSVIVGRGERARVTDSGGVELTRGAPLDDYFGWVEGRLALRGVPLREAARRLGRWYDIEVRLEPDSIGDRRIEAVADNEPVAEVLRSIAASLDLQLTREGRVYTLTAH